LPTSGELTKVPDSSMKMFMVAGFFSRIRKSMSLYATTRCSLSRESAQSV
jgi:hypothetical protein